jgi:biopolymer transport protein ExbD
MVSVKLNMKLQRTTREEPDLNLTPLIDVVFLLLIFFMVSTTFEKESEITIELPEASGEASTQPQQTIEIAIDAKGRFFVNEKEVVNTQVGTLRNTIKATAAGLKDPIMIISADKVSPHGAVIKAMDALRQLGFVNITFATQQAKK